MRGSRIRRLALPMVLAAAAWGLPLSAAHASGGTKSAPSSCPKKTTCTSNPSIAISTPSGGATVSGTVSVTGTASDGLGISNVAVSMDGGGWTTVTGTTSWSFSLNTTSYANGAHTLSARETDAAGSTSTTSETLNFQNQAPADSAPPTISVSGPAAGATVSGTVSVTGQASDDMAIASVAVAIDGGAWQAASGTTSWSAPIDSTSYVNGTHTLIAEATDTAGKTSTISESITFHNAVTTTSSNGDLNWTDTTPVDPMTSNSLSPIGRGKQAAWGSVTVILYNETYTNQYDAFFRDSSSGATSYVALPKDTSNGWDNANYVMSSPTDLWIESGDGPVYVRHYSFAGASLPTSATLVSSQTFGDTDSRHGDITTLTSGGLVIVWHQQGSTGPQGQYVAYRSPAGAWQTLGPFQFMPTRASKQVVAQNPGDGSIWVFSNPDGYTAIGAIHLTESSTGLSVDWTNATFLNDSAYGDLGPDLENPDLAVEPDPSTGTLALAYQDDHRQIFQTSPTVVTGSYVAVARISPAGTVSFISLPVYVERVSSLGLVVAPGQTWLAYRPINQVTMSFSELYADCYSNGSWHTAADLGTLASPYARVGYGPTRAEFSASMSDTSLHFFAVG